MIEGSVLPCVGCAVLSERPAWHTKYDHGHIREMVFAPWLEHSVGKVTCNRASRDYSNISNSTGREFSPVIRSYSLSPELGHMPPANGRRRLGSRGGANDTIPSDDQCPVFSGSLRSMESDEYDQHELEKSPGYRKFVTDERSILNKYRGRIRSTWLNALLQAFAQWTGWARTHDQTD